MRKLGEDTSLAFELSLRVTGAGGGRQDRSVKRTGRHSRWLLSGGLCSPASERNGDLGREQLGQIAEAKQFFYPRRQVEQFQRAVPLFEG